MVQASAFCHTINVSSFVPFVEGWNQTWAIVQTTHLAAMTMLVSSISIFDLRLLGVAMVRVPVSRLSRRLIPATWTAFALLVATGLLMFVAQKPKYCNNWIFLSKILLIFLAGLNMAVFQFTVFRKVDKWDDTSVTPLSAKLAGTFSVLLWAGVVVAGRWIGFIA